MSHTPELILKHTVAQAVASLRSNPEVLKAMFPTIQKFNPEIVDRLSTHLDQNDRFPVHLNYPKSEMLVPSVYIITARSPEDAENGVIGDVFGQDCILADGTQYMSGYPNPDNTDQKVIANTLDVGWFDAPTYQILVLTEEDELTNLFSAALRFYLVFSKLQLESTFGMIGMTTEELDFHLNIDFMPPQVYSRAILLRFAAVERKIAGHVFKDSKNEANFWHNISPVLNKFILTLLDGDGATLLDPDGSLEVVK